MKIAFHTNQLGLGGTEVALYDYADYNEKLLNNESIIISSKTHPANNADVVSKFANRFKNVFLYDNIAEIDPLLEKEKADVFYAIKLGVNDGVVSKVCKTGIHTVFVVNEPHGDVYFYVSEWLSKTASGGKYPFVPHIISLPQVDIDYRDFLNIPNDALVFGRYGSYDTFDIDFVKKAVVDISGKYKNIYFVFMNTKKFMEGRDNVIFLNGTSDMAIKTAFINTCDAMLHARTRGETFGISAGEFSIRNKPVLTYSASPERSHIEILGDKALLYSNYNELTNIITNYKDIYDKTRNYDCFSENFNPVAVMNKFEKVLLK